MKIGRNDPCTCGSGKKYKKCCLNAPPRMAPEMEHRLRLFLQRREASEMLRQQVQGYGKQIMTVVMNGQRVVYVNGQPYASDRWVLFTDFLDEFLARMLGGEFMARYRDPTFDHPIFRWWRKFQEYEKGIPAQGTRGLKNAEARGFIICRWRLAYSLYLIAHNDTIPQVWLDKIRANTDFYSTIYELIVGAICAISNFAIKCEEGVVRSQKVPEYSITSKRSGRTYQVECKRRSQWKVTSFDLDNADFQNELRNFLRRQLFDGYGKGLPDPIFWFELSIPVIHDRTSWLALMDLVRGFIEQAQSEIKIKGAPIGSSYVFITNHAFLVDEDVVGHPANYYILPVNRPDFIKAQYTDLELALDDYDRHADVAWLMKCLPISMKIPDSFDGQPIEIEDDDGKDLIPVRVGDIIDLRNPDGSISKGLVELVFRQGNDAEAYCFNEKTGMRQGLKFPLSPDAIKVVERYGNAVFGNPHQKHNVQSGDLFGLYEMVQDMVRNHSRDHLLAQVGTHPNIADFRRLELEPLRRRVCREMTKVMFPRG